MYSRKLSFKFQFIWDKVSRPCLLFLFFGYLCRNGNPLQCSCLRNPRDGGAWWAAVNGVAQSWTWLKWLSSSSMWDLSSPNRDQTHSPCMGSQSLNHWTAREVPRPCFLIQVTAIANPLGNTQDVLYARASFLVCISGCLFFSVWFPYFIKRAAMCSKKEWKDIFFNLEFLSLFKLHNVPSCQK